MTRRPAVARALVCLAAVLPYLPALNDYFVQDDFGVVWLLSAKPWSAFPGWFTTTWMDDIWGYTPDEIRPFPAVTYQIAAVWGPGSPVPNHAINVALHAVNGLLVLAMARTAAGLSLAAATVAALVFVLLPNQAESVAWITGRVDSMPALLYIGAFLCYVRWRRSDRLSLYAGAVVLCFAALFSKQTAITFGPALVLYDAVALGRRPRPTWAWLRPYVPFALLTVGYLVLRYVLFGEIAREGQLTATGLGFSATLVGRHVQRVVFGHAAGVSALMWVLPAVVLAFALWTRARAAMFFGVLWFALHVAPVVVAGYESPRHAYLASAAWALLLGLALDALPRRAWSAPAWVSAAAAVAVYSIQLWGVVAEWGTRASVSKAAVIDLEREARAAPPGTLIVAAAPVRSWEWASPFVLRPPFTAQDQESRVRLVTPQPLYCCRAQWDAATRSTLRDWLTSAGRPPAVALRWDEETGALFRLSEGEEPYLRSLLAVLAETDSPQALDRGLRELAGRLPPARPSPLTP